MAFLQVNGYTIPVATCQRGPDLLIGGKGRAYDGTPQTQDRGRRIILKCTTPPLIEATREAIIGIIRGDGFVWPWDSDLFSHKGIGPATGTDQATQLDYLAGDGDPITSMAYLVSVLSNYTPLRNGILSNDPDSTNMLAADQRDAEDAPNGYTAINGATLTGNINHFVDGTKSLRIVTDAVGADVEGGETDATDPGAGSATKVYVGSVYIKNETASAKTVGVHLRDVTNAANGTAIQVSLPANDAWVRIACTITIGAVDCRDLRMQILEEPADSGITIYCDRFQIEEKSYPTAWVDGARGGGDDLGYDFDFTYSFTDWSFGAWFWGPAVARLPAVDGSILSVTGGSSNFALWRLTASSDLIQLATGVGASGTTLDTGAGDVDWEAWNFIGVSFRTDPESGESITTMRLINGSGSTTYTGSPPVDFVLDQSDTISVGNRNGIFPWIGHLGELVLFPFAVPVGVWDGIASTLGQVGDGTADAIPLPQWPRKLVTGDVAVTQPIGSTARLYGKLFEGDAGTIAMMGGNPDTAYRTNLAAVAFTLEQV